MLDYWKRFGLLVIILSLDIAPILALEVFLKYMNNIMFIVLGSFVLLTAMLLAFARKRIHDLVEGLGTCAEYLTLPIAIIFILWGIGSILFLPYKYESLLGIVGGFLSVPLVGWVGDLLSDVAKEIFDE